MDWPILALGAALLVVLAILSARKTEQDLPRIFTAGSATAFASVFLISFGHVLQPIGWFLFFGRAPVAGRIQSIGVVAVEAFANFFATLAGYAAPIFLVAVISIFPVALIRRRSRAMAISAISFAITQSIVDYTTAPSPRHDLPWAFACNALGATVLAWFASIVYEWALSTPLVQLWRSGFGMRAVGTRGMVVGAGIIIGLLAVTFRIPTSFRVTLSDPESLHITGSLPGLGPNFDKHLISHVRMETKSRMTVAAVSPIGEPLSSSAAVSRRTLETMGKEELCRALLSEGELELSSDVISVSVGKIGGEQSLFVTFAPQIRPIDLSLEKVSISVAGRDPPPSLFKVSLAFPEPQAIKVADFSGEPVDVEVQTYSENISGAGNTGAPLSGAIARWLGWGRRQDLEIGTNELTTPIYHGPASSLDITLEPLGENPLLQFGRVERLSYMTGRTVLQGGFNGDLGFIESLSATVEGGSVRQGFATDSVLRSGDRIEIRSAAELMSIRVNGERTFVVEGRYAFLSINGELVSNTLWGAFGDTTRGIILGILITGGFGWIRKRWRQIPRAGSASDITGR